jgi:hypothetical protein
LYPWVCGTFQSPNAWAWWHCDLLQAVMTSAGHTLDLQELNFVQEQLRDHFDYILRLRYFYACDLTFLS